MSDLTIAPDTAEGQAPPSAMDELALLCVELAQLQDQAELLRAALVGYLVDAVKCQVPIDELRGFLEPVEDGLSGLSQDLEHRARKLGRLVKVIGAPLGEVAS